MAATEEFKKLNTLIGDRLRYLRIKHKMKTQEVADFLEITRASVVNMESGRHMPSIINLIRLKALYKTSYEYLFPELDSLDEQLRQITEQRKEKESRRNAREIAKLEVKLKKLKGE